VIKETINSRWQHIDFFQHVLLIFTFSAASPPRDISIIRECVYNAELTEEVNSTKLQFITEGK
jgi:hypothetical protein